MCGIVGLIRLCPDGDVDSQAITTAADLLHHRGPDDSGIWLGDGVGLGHRRLAVIDTSVAGHQPMISFDGRYILVFNGEIYNHKNLRNRIGDAYPWRGQSDSEVVLAAYIHWGVECLQHFHGMFAFAIWDNENRALFAARDRMGVKPLYYHRSRHRIAFASRPRALRGLIGETSPTPDLQSLRYYLECGYIPAPYSFHENIRKLPPAHYLLTQGKDLVVDRYWDFNTIVPEISWERRDEEDLLDELDDIVFRCVRSRMLSDVPLGAFLSGGIDSSLVVAMMSRHSSESVKTFTVGFEEKEYDESPYALEVAEHLCTEHYSEQLSVNDLLELIPDYSREFDEPFFDSSSFPTMAVSRLARQHVVVSLSGDGGDELFGGYHYHRIAEILGSFYKAPTPLRRLIASAVGVIPGHRYKLLSSAMSQGGLTESYAFMRSIKKDFDSLLHDDVTAGTSGLKELFSDVVVRSGNGLSGSEIGMRLDATFTLPDDFMQKVDVASMCYSLESREPLLDQELVEWAMKLPLKWKIRKNGGKYLLRKLAYRYVPQRVLDRPKQGFSVPIDEWLRGPLRAWALERLHDKRFYSYLPVDRDKVIGLFRLHESGKRDVHPLLWSVLMLIEYCYQYEDI